jgi:hypothetical protein
MNTALAAEGLSLRVEAQSIRKAMGALPTGAAVPPRLRHAPVQRTHWRSAGAPRPGPTNAHADKAGLLPSGVAASRFWRFFLPMESCSGFGRGQPHFYSATAGARHKLQTGCRVREVSGRSGSLTEARRRVGGAPAFLPAGGRSAIFPADTGSFAALRRSEYRHVRCRRSRRFGP